MTAVGPRPAAWLVIVATATIAVILRLVLGARGWSWPTLEIADLRVGAIVSATVAGASLGLSGVLLQALLRNPLASPFVLGLSSGAGLSVSIAALVASSGAAWVIADGGMVAASVGSAVALVVALLRPATRRRADWLAFVACVIVGFAANAAPRSNDATITASIPLPLELPSTAPAIS
jgi:ABC-type Fe3+-siderophore transport system permease subunit